ncbi:MAG: glycosyltransferase family 39 protein, partial [Gammaproteobacteria bacterium]|nr:glycosyltransferase family 39 protein [Gammaproteobacteria bacterium]
MVQLFASMTLESSPHKMPAPLNLLVLALLCVFFAQAVGRGARTSITIDEGLHITSGYAILRTGDFRLVEEHPPLVKLLEALPLLAVPGLPDPTTLPGWESDVAVTDSVRLVRATQSLIYPYQPIDRLVFAARVPVALLAVLLGAIVFRWATDLGGWKSGLRALFLLTFDPDILAHAGVAGTDLGAACFITLALFGLARFLRRPTVPRLVFAGVTLGLAQGAKLSALILLPVVALLVVLALPRRRILSLLLLLLVAGLVLWGLYGFEIGSVPGVPFPIPAASHAIPWLRLRQHMADGHAAFLMGENSSQGWWYYFPVAFGLKTPLPTLLLLMISLVANLRSPTCGERS